MKKSFLFLSIMLFCCSCNNFQNMDLLNINYKSSSSKIVATLPKQREIKYIGKIDYADNHCPVTITDNNVVIYKNVNFDGILKSYPIDGKIIDNKLELFVDDNLQYWYNISIVYELKSQVFLSVITTKANLEPEAPSFRDMYSTKLEYDDQQIVGLFYVDNYNYTIVTSRKSKTITVVNVDKNIKYDKYFLNDFLVCDIQHIHVNKSDSCKLMTFDGNNLILYDIKTNELQMVSAFIFDNWYDVNECRLSRMNGRKGSTKFYLSTKDSLICLNLSGSISFESEYPLANINDIVANRIIKTDDALYYINSDYLNSRTPLKISEDGWDFLDIYSDGFGYVAISIIKHINSQSHIRILNFNEEISSYSSYNLTTAYDLTINDDIKFCIRGKFFYGEKMNALTEQ